MTSKPRVTASSSVEAVSRRALCEAFPRVSPGVEIRVDFDLHDHKEALAALDRAVADVEAQIEETGK